MSRPVIFIFVALALVAISDAAQETAPTSNAPLNGASDWRGPIDPNKPGGPGYQAPIAPPPNAPMASGRRGPIDPNKPGGPGYQAINLPVNVGLEKIVYKLCLQLEGTTDLSVGERVLQMASDAFSRSGRFLSARNCRPPTLDDFISGSAPDLIGIVRYEGGVTQNGMLSQWRIDVRLVDAHSRAIASVGVISDGPHDILIQVSFDDAEQGLLQSIRSAFPPVGRIIGSNQQYLRVNIGADEGLTDGDTLEIVLENGPAIHPVTGVFIPSTVVVVGEAVIQKTFPKFSDCMVISATTGIDHASLVRLKARNKYQVEH